MRFGCPRVAARHKRAYLGKENPFAEHKDVAGDTRQGSRSAAGSDWMDHKAEHRSILLIRPLHPLRLTTFGREIAGLLWSGQGGFSAKRGFILPRLMNRSNNFFPSAASALCGLIVYVLITVATGKNEAWDDGIYYSVGIPFMSVVAFVLGYLFPVKPWRWAASMAGGQVIGALMFGSSLNLLPLAMIFMTIISLPQLLAAFVGSKLAPKKASQ